MSVVMAQLSAASTSFLQGARAHPVPHSGPDVPSLSQHPQGGWPTHTTAAWSHSLPVPHHFPGLWSQAPVAHSDSLLVNTLGASAAFSSPTSSLSCLYFLRFLISGSASGIISAWGDLSPGTFHKALETFLIVTGTEGKMLLVSGGQRLLNFLQLTEQSPTTKNYLA